MDNKYHLAIKEEDHVKCYNTLFKRNVSSVEVSLVDKAPHANWNWKVPKYFNIRNKTCGEIYIEGQH